MATDENNHKNEARDDWTGCTFRVERGPSSEGRAWGMADILTDVRRRVWPARPGISPRRPARDRARPRRRLTAPAQAFAGHAEDHWINVVTSRAGGAFAEVRRPPAPREPARRAARGPPLPRYGVGGAAQRAYARCAAALPQTFRSDARRFRERRGRVNAELSTRATSGRCAAPLIDSAAALGGYKDRGFNPENRS